jgi:glycosyltransferase involved in cell wall biosynthesis
MSRHEYNFKKTSMSVLGIACTVTSFIISSFSPGERGLENISKINESDKQFVIITTAFKAKDWYRKSLDSVVGQTYPNWELIYVADGDGLPESDGTGDAVQEYIQDHKLESKITLIRNAVRKDKLCNVYDAIHRCDKHKIIVMLDYDDWLYDNNVLKYLNQVYKEPYKGNDI